MSSNLRLRTLRPTSASPNMIAPGPSHFRLVYTLLLTFSLWTSTSHAKTILVFGDSLSAGHGLSPQALWVEQLKNRLSPAYKVVNASISGETSDGGIRRLPGELARHNPDIIILELGGNDGLRGFPLPVIKHNLQTMIQLCRQQSRQVLLVGMHIPPNYGKRYSEAFHQLYGDLGKELGVAVLPFLLEGVATHPDLMQEDGIHPNEKGQPKIRDTVLEALQPML